MRLESNNNTLLLHITGSDNVTWPMS